MKRKKILIFSPFLIFVLFFILFVLFSNPHDPRLANDTGTSSGSSQTLYSNATANSLVEKQDVATDGYGGAPAAKKAAASKIAAAKMKASAASAAAKANLNQSSDHGISASSAVKYLRKVILNGSLDIETTQFDKAVSNIVQITSRYGGYVASSNITGVKADNGNYLENRTASYSIRIPASQFNAFMQSAGSLGVITGKTSSGEDITSQYYDTQARLDSQRIKEARLLAILKKTTTLADVMALETELENTRYQIETLTGSLKMWDDLVQFSTINISLSEVTVKKIITRKPITLRDRLHSGFSDSIDSLTASAKNLLVDFVAFLPYGAILILLMGLGYGLYRLIRRKK